MKTYFKAVRPDGTDFHTGTVLYEVGTQLPRIPSQKGIKRSCCSNTVYHASDTPSETLIGGSWPARLFEMSGRPVASEGHKYGFVTLRVERELESHLVFGPNGEDVVRIIEQAKSVTPAQAEQLRAARVAAWVAARVAAWYEDRVAAWHAAREAAVDEAREAAWHAAQEAAVDEAVNAAIATVVRDYITPEQYHTLTKVWFEVIGDLS